MSDDIKIPNHSRMDAADTTFFTRELAHIREAALEQKMPEYKAARLIPMNTSLDSTEKVYIWRQEENKGDVSLITDYSKDFPRVNVNQTENTQILADYGVSFGYTIDEIKLSQRLGKSLDLKRATNARAKLAQAMDKIMFGGDAVAGLVGFNALANRQSFTISGGVWSGKTADQILTDMFGMRDQLATTTLDVEAPSKLLLPIAQFRLISEKRLSTSASDTSVLEFFKKNCPEVEVESWFRLAGAGAGPSDRAVMYRPDPNALEGLVAVDFEQFAPELSGMQYTINCRMKIGGVVAYRPKSIIYGDGI